MSTKMTCELILERDLFDLEEARDAQRQADSCDGVVYCWKTTGRWNWLERGFSIVDVLGLLVLPKGLPPVIDMPDDPVEESD